MPDADDVKEGKKYYSDIPQKTEGFFLKGCNNLDWGMKKQAFQDFQSRNRTNRDAGH